MCLLPVLLKLYTWNSCLSDVWMPLTRGPSFKLHSTLSTPWSQHSLPSLLLEGLHCYFPTSWTVPRTQKVPRSFVILTLSLYSSCIAGMCTATRIIKRNVSGLGRWTLPRFCFLVYSNLLCKPWPLAKAIGLTFWKTITATGPILPHPNVINSNEKVQADWHGE